jgi:hypothetical protein
MIPFVQQNTEDHLPLGSCSLTSVIQGITQGAPIHLFKGFHQPTNIV